MQFEGPAHSYHSPRLGRGGSGLRIWILAFGLAVCGFSFPASAACAPPASNLEPVVRGRPASQSAEAVALCPDISDRKEVFLARDGNGLAGRLARAGYRVYLVDPWNTTEARSKGFDGVVQSVFPRLLQELEERSGTGRVTWIGHGLCGFLPVAAAARPGEGLPTLRWAALGTRFDFRLVSPLLRTWLQSWIVQAEALPVLAQQVLFTGLRPAAGPRRTSLPPAAEGTPGSTLAEILERFHRAEIARPPPRAVVEDLLRWFDEGRPTDRAGWVDYSRGLDAGFGEALVVVGASDPVAPPEMVLGGADRLARKIPVELRFLSRISGDREEFGHLGMLLSRHSAHSVDRTILSWLRGRGSSW